MVKWVEVWPIHKVEQCMLLLVPGCVIAILDFVDNLSNATFGGSDGMGDDATIISGQPNRRDW